MKRQLRVCSAAIFLAAVFILSLWLPGTTATAQAASAAPAVPKAVGSANANIVTLKWSAVSGAQGYEVFKVGTDKKYHWFKTLNEKTTTLKLTGKYNLTYYYKIRSYKTSGDNKVYSDFCNVQVKTAPAPSTVITSTSRDKKDSGIVRWKENSYADGYEIYRSTQAKGVYQKIATINKSSIHAVRDTKLSSSSAYYYKVRAYTKNSNSKAYGAFGGSKALTKYVEPDQTSSEKRKLVIVGDSRVLFMSRWFPNSRINYIAKSGIGLSWLMDSSVESKILAALDGKTDLFVWIGTNDYDYIQRYISYYQKMVPQWKNKGAKVYLVGLGQFLDGSDGYGGFDKDLIRFNTSLKEAVSGMGSNVFFVDLYAYLKTKKVSYMSGDRVHYSEDTTKTVLNYLISIADR